MGDSCKTIVIKNFEKEKYCLYIKKLKIKLNKDQLNKK